MKSITGFVTAALLAVGLSSAAQARIPFGQPDDDAFAEKLWDALAGINHVGPGSTIATTYAGGTAPHPETLVTLQGSASVDGEEDNVS